MASNKADVSAAKPFTDLPFSLFLRLPDTPEKYPHISQAHVCCVRVCVWLCVCKWLPCLHILPQTTVKVVKAVVKVKDLKPGQSWV